MISSFLLKYPDVSVYCKYFWRGEFENAELLRHYDYILSQYSDELYENLARQFIAVESALFAVFPLSHRLASRKSVRIEELAEERFIMPRQGVGFYNLYMNTCRKAGFEPNVVAEGDVLLRVQLLRDEVGILLSAESSAIPDLAGNAVMIPIEGLEHKYTQAILWDKRRMFGRAAKLFKNYVLDYFKAK
jgi:DNA-binding transcriptional LysR family regulator